MVAGHRKILRAVGKDIAGHGIGVGALDARQLAMHRRVDTFQRAAEGRGKRLMPEADPQKRHTARRGADQLDRHAGILRRSGAGREDQTFRAAVQNLFRGRGVIAHDLDLAAEIRQEVPQVPGETVVIVDQDEHRMSGEGA